MIHDLSALAKHRDTSVEEEDDFLAGTPSINAWPMLQDPDLLQARAEIMAYMEQEEYLAMEPGERLRFLIDQVPAEIFNGNREPQCIVGFPTLLLYGNGADIEDAIAVATGLDHNLVDDIYWAAADSIFSHNLPLAKQMVEHMIQGNFLTWYEESHGAWHKTLRTEQDLPLEVAR